MARRPFAALNRASTDAGLQGGEKQCCTYPYLRPDGLRFSVRRVAFELRSSSIRP